MSTYSDAKDEIGSIALEAIAACHTGDYAAALALQNMAIKAVGKAAKIAMSDGDAAMSRDLVKIMSYLSAQADFIHKLDRLEKGNA